MGLSDVFLTIGFRVLERKTAKVKYRSPHSTSEVHAASRLTADDVKLDCTAEAVFVGVLHPVPLSTLALWLEVATHSL